MLWRWSSTKCLCACLQGVQLLTSASTHRAPPPLAREVVRVVPADATGPALTAAAGAGAHLRAQPSAAHVRRALLPEARGAGGAAVAAPAQQPPPGGGLAQAASWLRGCHEAQPGRWRDALRHRFPQPSSQVNCLLLLPTPTPLCACTPKHIPSTLVALFTATVSSA